MTAAAAAAPDAVPRRGKKKLIVTLAAVVLVLAVAAAGALWWLSRSAAHAEGDDEDVAAEVEHKADPKAVPTFVPLETFTVNLADRDGERYAQIGITLEVRDGKVADQIKVYMPAIRNNILMVLAHKTSAELLQREGKQRLAAEIRRETLRPLGVELPPEAPAGSAADADAKARKAQRATPADVPVRQVHFSNFIIQ